MLDQAHRLRTATDFRATVRRGVKGSRPTLVVHLLIGDRPTVPTTVGFVVSKQVGSAVVRNRVRRRLRHLMRDRLAIVPPGSRVVVRALPAAATARRLDDDLDRALHRAVHR